MFGEQQLSNAKWMIELQKQLLNLESTTMQKVTEWIMENGGVSRLSTIIRILVRISVIRHSKLDLYTAVFIAIANASNCALEMLEILFSKYLLNSERFILNLLQIGFIEPQFLIMKIKPLLESATSFKNLISLFAYFSPEIEAFCSEQMTRFLAQIDQLMRDDIVDYEKQFLKGYEFYRNDKWKLLNERRFNCYESGSLEEFVMKDDANSLHQLMHEEGFNKDQVILHTVFSHSVFPLCDPTIVQLCAINGSVNCMKLLIREGCDLEKVTENGVTTSQFAVAGGNMEIISMLKKIGLDFSETLQAAVKFFRNEYFIENFDAQKLTEFGNSFDSIVNCCATEMNMEIFLFLMEHDCDINMKGRYDYTPLHCSLIYGGSSFTSLILSHKNIDVNAKTSGYEFPVFIAARVNEVDSLKILLKNKNLETKCDNLSRNPLHYACANNCRESLQLLIDSELYDVTQSDCTGKTPLHVAIARGSSDCVKILVANPHIDLWKVDITGNTPIDLARKSGDPKIIGILEAAIEDESSDPETTEYSQEEEEEEEEYLDL